MCLSGTHSSSELIEITKAALTTGPRRYWRQSILQKVIISVLAHRPCVKCAESKRPEPLDCPSISKIRLELRALRKY